MKKAERISRKAEKLSKKGKSDEAIELAKKAVSLLETTVGPEHMEVAKALCFLADLYICEGEKLANNEVLYEANVHLDTDEMKKSSDQDLVLQKLENQKPEYHDENGELVVSLAEYYSISVCAHAVLLYERALSIMANDEGTTVSDWSEVLCKLYRLYTYFLIDAKSEILNRLRQLGLDDSMAKTVIGFIVKFEQNGEMGISKGGQYILDQAESLFEQENFEAAAKEYRKLLVLEPKFSQAYLYLGDCYYGMHQYESALEYFKKAIELDPENPQTLAFLGDTYLHLQDPQSAHELFKKAVDLDPEYANAVEKLKTTRKILQNINGEGTMCEVQLDH